MDYPGREFNTKGETGQETLRNANITGWGEENELQRNSKGIISERKKSSKYSLRSGEPGEKSISKRQVHFLQ